MKGSSTAAIILAAGASTRFGSNKLSHQVEWNGKRMCVLSHSLKPWLNAFSQVHIVVDARNAQLQEKVEYELEQTDRLTWMLCTDANNGMAHSLRFGVQQIPDSRAWMIGLGDMPYLSPASIGRVKLAMEEGAAIVAPFFNGKRGHPIGFSRQFKPALLQLEGDHGARKVLAEHESTICRIETDDEGILLDIDEIKDIRVHEAGMA